MVVSLSSKRGGSMPASRDMPFLARSEATWTWRVSANMSGHSRVLSNTEGSTFLAVAKACALSRTPDSALRPSSRAGREALDLENDMRRVLGLGELGALD